MDPDWRWKFPIENGDFPASHVSLLEGNSNSWQLEAAEATSDQAVFWQLRGRFSERDWKVIQPKNEANYDSWAVVGLVFGYVVFNGSTNFKRFPWISTIFNQLLSKNSEQNVLGAWVVGIYEGFFRLPGVFDAQGASSLDVRILGLKTGTYLPVLIWVLYKKNVVQDDFFRQLYQWVHLALGWSCCTEDLAELTIFAHHVVCPLSPLCTQGSAPREIFGHCIRTLNPEFERFKSRCTKLIEHDTADGQNPAPVDSWGW